jgi:hypothetical protein
MSRLAGREKESKRDPGQGAGTYDMLRCGRDVAFANLSRYPEGMKRVRRHRSLVEQSTSRFIFRDRRECQREILSIRGQVAMEWIYLLNGSVSHCRKRSKKTYNATQHLTCSPGVDAFATEPDYLVSRGQFAYLDKLTEDAEDLLSR